MRGITIFFIALLRFTKSVFSLIWVRCDLDIISTVPVGDQFVYIAHNLSYRSAVKVYLLRNLKYVYCLKRLCEIDLHNLFLVRSRCQVLKYTIQELTVSWDGLGAFGTRRKLGFFLRTKAWNGSKPTLKV